MKRKKFISQLVYGTSGIILLPSLLSCQKTESGLADDNESPDDKPSGPIQSNGKIKFGIITDVHQDLFPEAEERLAKFIDAATAANVDFIIQVGDFAYPLVDVNDNFLSIWNSFKGPKFHVLGNHDMDRSSKTVFMDFVGHTHGPHYSYDQGGFHFVVLDTNYIKQAGAYMHYEDQNYYNFLNSEIGYVSNDQLDWLKEDLSKTDKPTFVFSHQPLNGSAGNSAEVQKIFKEENAKGKKVIACFSGHLHKNWYLLIDGVHHVQVNSASYYFVGPNFPKVYNRYPKEVEKEYPILPLMAPYDDSLFAIVEVDGPSRSLSIEGRKSNFVAPSPYELDYYKNTGQLSPSSNIDSRVIKF